VSFVSTKAILAAAICTIAFSASNRTARAESLEVQCRAAVRAELKGADCRIGITRNTGSERCNMSTHGDISAYDNKVIECVRRGGPGRKTKP
jgi:hypothetical protein